MKKKIGRNELCWCSSGRKYKRCHLHRDREATLPFQAIDSEIRQAGAYRTCLHPSAAKGACGRVISAHTLQKSRVLRAISDESKHVLTFYPIRIGKDTNQIELRETGWNKASTFDAFCDLHDESTFAPLEKVPFAGIKEQIFLIAYRAVCWEFYQKVRALKMFPRLSELIDRGLPTSGQREIQRAISVQNAGYAKGLKDVRKVKFRMDEALKSKEYTPINTFEVCLEGVVSIAATGCITPNRSLRGGNLQKLHDPNAQIEWLAFGIDVKTPSEFSVVFSWLTSHAASGEYIESVLDLSEKDLPEFLAQFFFVHCENTYFSPAWWNSLKRTQQEHVRSLVANTNPYYSEPCYDFTMRIAPWKFAYCKM